jgi:hypothetical protein
MRWAGHVSTHGGDVVTQFSLESVNGRDHSEDLGVDGRIILK